MTHVFYPAIPVPRSGIHVPRSVTDGVQSSPEVNFRVLYQMIELDEGFSNWGSQIDSSSLAFLANRIPAPRKSANQGLSSRHQFVNRPDCAAFRNPIRTRGKWRMLCSQFIAMLWIQTTADLNGRCNVSYRKTAEMVDTLTKCTK